MTLGTMAPPVVTTIARLERRPTSGLSEGDLVAGYSGAVRVEPCVCGGEIRAADNPGAIGQAVAVHNASTAHEQWRRRMET